MQKEEGKVAEATPLPKVAVEGGIPPNQSVVPGTSPQSSILWFPDTTDAVIQHAGVSLSGRDVNSIVETLFKVYKEGVPLQAQSTHFHTLLSVFQFIWTHVKKDRYMRSFVGTTAAGNGSDNKTRPRPEIVLLKLPTYHHVSVTALDQLTNADIAKRQYAQFALQVQAMKELRDPVFHGQISHKLALDLHQFYDMEKQAALRAQVEAMSRSLSCCDMFQRVVAHPPFVEKCRPLSHDILAWEASEQKIFDRKQTRKLDASYEMMKAQTKSFGLRKRVYYSVPAAMWTTGKFRPAKSLATAGRNRAKQRRKRMQNQNKEARQEHRRFLSAITTHAKEFSVYHNANRRTARKIAGDVLRWVEDAEKGEDNQQRRLDRERLVALRNNDQDEYMRLLKQTKNARLTTLLNQTEQYMDKLTRQIISEQDGAGLEATLEREGHPEEEKELGFGIDMTGSRQRYYAATRRVKEEIKVQPTSLAAGLKLRGYQLAGLSWMVSLYNNHLNGILADEMGLGKTIQSVSLIAWLMESRKVFGPFLFIVPMSTLRNNWESEFVKWLPQARRIVYDGDKANRKMIRERYLNTGDYNVCMTTYEFAMRDKKFLSKIEWRYIIVDEAHRLKNPTCKLVQDLGQYDIKSRRIALTGTPLQNSLPELWSLLNFLHPDIFNSADTFEKWFSKPFEKMGGADVEESNAMTDEEKLLVIDRLHSIVRPFMLRREKHEVETELQDKIERILRCDLTPPQRVLYEAVLNGKVPLQNRMMQLRKVCNHPYLFHPYTRRQAGSEEYPLDDRLISLSGKMIMLDQILLRLFKTNHRVLLFSQYTKTMDLLGQYFEFRGFRFLRLDGTTDATERKRGLEMYNAPDSEYFIFMLSTRAGGLGLNLQTADTVILYDSDWNPQNDMQAQARAHRIGQKKQVVVLRLVSNNTVEEKVLSTANHKMDKEQMAISAGMYNQGYKAGEAKKKIQRVLHLKEAEDDGISEEGISEEAVCQAIARTEEELALYMDSSQFGRKVERFAEGIVPRWMLDFVQLGNRSYESSCDPVAFAGFHEEEEEEETDVIVGKRKRTAVSYREVTDAEFFSDEKKAEQEAEEEANKQRQQQQQNHLQTQPEESQQPRKKHKKIILKLSPPPPDWSEEEEEEQVQSGKMVVEDESKVL